MFSRELQNSKAEEVLEGMHFVAGDDIRCASLEQRLEQLNDCVASLQAAIRTAAADTQYARQRAQADLAHAHKFGIENFAKALLPFKDALEAALAVETSDANALRAGLELSLRQLEAALEKNGLAEICPSAGTQFDAQKHRPLVKLGAEDEMRTVVCTEQKGYEIHGRVLRPALVTLR